MKIGVYRTIFIKKTTKVSIRQWYIHSTKCEKILQQLSHFFGARAMFLLFCDHQDTEYAKRKIYFGISQPIFTHKNIS